MHPHSPSSAPAEEGLFAFWGSERDYELAARRGGAPGISREENRRLGVTA